MIQKWKIITLCTVLIIALYGGQYCLSETDGSTPPSKYIEAIELGAQWFVNNQDDSFIHYKYYPYKDKYASEHQRLREFGALWSIAKAGNFFNNEDFKELANRGFAYFEDTFTYDEDNDFYYINITPGKLKLGYSAFAILTLLEIEHPHKDQLLKQLANGILYQQQLSGRLKTFFFSDRNTGVDYYPGEALLALMALYEYTQDDTYLNAVKKAFPYYRGYFEDKPNTAFPPWQSRAYYKLYKATGNIEVKNFLFVMSDYMLGEYNPKNECSNFDIAAAGSVVAVHSEGVNMAYDLAEGEQKECYKNFSQEAADYILSIQLTDTEKYPLAAIGGILGNETSTNMRVDRNQHAILALIDAYNFGILE